MAEAEDVIVDAARHATDWTRQLWRRHRGPSTAPPRPLDEAAPRIELLLAAVFDRSFRLLAAEPPAPPTWLSQWFDRGAAKAATRAVPATDGRCIWLPAQGEATATLKLLALQQAMRAERGAPATAQRLEPGIDRIVYAVLEADAADRDLARRLPGMRTALTALRERALRERALPQRALRQRAWPDRALPQRALPQRALPERALPGQALCEPASCEPALSVPASRERAFREQATAAAHAAPCADVEALLRQRLATPIDGGAAPAPADVAAQAQAMAAALRERLARAVDGRARRGAMAALRDRLAPREQTADASILTDLWLGELHPPPDDAVAAVAGAAVSDRAESPPRSARLPRSPRVRPAAEDENDPKPGAWMVQTAQPHEQAEDPAGLQRPSDRDEATAAGEYADALSELPQARLVWTPEPAREVLLSESLALPRRRRAATGTADSVAHLNYPEWDHRSESYRDPGATVHVKPAAEGPQSWVDATLAQHAPLVRQVQRRFEALRPQRLQLRRQIEGDDIDLDACIDARVDFAAGLPLPQGLYRQQRAARRDTAVLVLADASGSTDAWVAAGRRIVDVEREALLLVSIALQRLGEPYAVAAFSGTGPQGVVVRVLKGFEEAAGSGLARRIAGIEPEHHTRAGAALRHATAMLMRQPAHHRLLLLLSDGRPNDIDEYEGRYGVEDMRQAVAEARLQGLHPFCMTVDRSAAAYLPAIFGAYGCTLLPRPERLPVALLQWLQRVVRQ